VAEQERIFRQVREGDFEELFALYASSFKDLAPHLPFEEGIINKEDSYCAVLQGQIVALVTANPVCYKNQKGHQIFKLCTHSAFRGRGIAGALLSFMHEERRKKGELFSLVMPGSDGLYAFYATKGYEPIFAKRQHRCKGQALELPEERVRYTEKYSRYVLKSALANRKVQADGQGLLWGFEREEGVFLDDCLESVPEVHTDCFFYLPQKKSGERYGMVCPLLEGVDVEGLLPLLVCGFS
jgi:predicted N-acetyltransferase YhbS